MLIAETDRLILRHFHVADTEPMMSVFGDSEVMRFGSGTKSREEVEAWLKKCLEDYFAKWGFGLWAVVEKESEQVIGYCGLTRFPDIDGQQEIEVGYRLARAYWGRGYASEAALAVRDYAFATLNLQRLIAIVDPENAASIRVAEKIGLRYEKDVMLKGYTHPDRIYAIVRSRG
jgi:[ribosomal protein S5]-alanine N-acetyltransferase